MPQRRYIDLDTGRVAASFTAGNLGADASLDLTKGSADAVSLYFIRAGAFVRLGTGWEIEFCASQAGVFEPANYVIQTLTADFAETDDSAAVASGAYAYTFTPVTDTQQARALLRLNGAGITSDDLPSAALTGQWEIVTATSASPILTRPVRITLTAPVISSAPAAPTAP